MPNVGITGADKRYTIGETVTLQASVSDAMANSWQWQVRSNQTTDWIDLPQTEPLIDFEAHDAFADYRIIVTYTDEKGLEHKVESSPVRVKRATEVSGRRSSIVTGPPAQSIGFLTLTAAAYFAFGVYEGESDLVKSLQWDVWKLTVSLTVSVALIMGVLGMAKLKKFNADHGQFWLQVTTRELVGHVIAAFIFIGLVFFLLLSQTSVRDRQWPIPGNLHISARWSLEGIEVRTGAVLLTTAISAVPWLVLVWLAHQSARDLRSLEGAGRRGVIPGRLGRLLRLWDLINDCVLSFAIFVVISLIPTGVLRSTWFAQVPAKPPESFPSTDVLLFGAFFAIILAAVALPLIASWRRAASQLLEENDPHTELADLTKESQERFDLIQSRLGLDAGLLRSPLTAVTLLIPLVTTLLSVFIPELAQK